MLKGVPERPLNCGKERSSARRRRGGLSPNRGKQIVFLNQTSDALLATRICRNMARRTADGGAPFNAVNRA
jgi:hypothetical protein